MNGSDRFGGMPFAVIAVTLLLASTALVAVVQQYGDTEDGAEDLEDGIDAVDMAVADIQTYVNRGLGEVVRGLSTASDDVTDARDTVEERAETFRSEAKKWLEFQFPIRSGGAVAELGPYELDLTAEALGLSSESGDGGYTPAYLKGTGTVHVTVRSDAGRGEADLEISTDGSYALPLSAERQSLFEGMAGSGGVSVSQMMTYQLTSLAQYRVMNGYGAMSEYGARGTTSIITADDVRAAYRNALEAVSMICFRDEDNSLSGFGQVDLSDLLVSEDGEIVLDLSAVYSQALMSVIDDIALSWFDYVMGFQVLDALDRVLFPFRDAVAALAAFLLGDEAVYSAVPYVEKTMELAGIDPDEYSRPGAGTSTVSAAGITVTVENPTSDVLSKGWLRDFGKRYTGETNFIMDFILDVLRRASVSLAENMDLGTVSVPVDAYDDSPFLDALAELFDRAVSDGMSAVEDTISESLSSGTVYDPFYGAIADEIQSHADEFVLSSELESRLVSAWTAAIPEGSEITPAMLAESGAVERAVHAYKASVHADLALFDELRRVADGDGVVKRVLSEICAFGLGLIGITDCVPERMGVMCDEILAMNAINPHGGVTELPGTTGFRLEDGSGMTVLESLNAEVSGSLIVGNVSIDRDRCVHTVGFREDSSAAYSTVIVIDVSDLIDVRVVGSGAMSEAMGTFSSVMEDTVSLDTTIEVTVASGWALAGIEYIPSTTLYEDLWNLLLELLEPIIEPLRKIMEAVRSVMTTISEALMEALTFVSEQLTRIYQAVIGPLSDLKGWFESAVETVFTEAALDVLVSIGLDEQTVTLEFFGCTLEFCTDAVTWAANTKTLLSVTLTMPVAGLTVYAGITAKVRGEVEAENLIITGKGGIEGDGWSVDVTLDPLMRGGKYLITVDGEVGNTDISLVAPRLEDYHEMGIALSDVPGIGEAIGNIPVMGVRVGLDAGFGLKYSDPMDDGLIVNEFESNPAGEDRGHEWVELLNNSPTSIDLDGYTLLAASDRRTKCMELSGTIGPGEFLVVYPEFTLVNSSGKYTKNGEAIVLKDPDGNEVDRTPTKKDGSNDGMTWQRSFDGSTEWVFAEGTQGRSNSAYPGSSLVSAAELKDAVWTAVEKSFDRVGTITNLESLQTFVQYLVRYTLEELIDAVAGRILEASVFVSLDVGDMASVSETGVRVALRTDGDLVVDVLRYITGMLMELILRAENPYSIDPLGMFTENIDLEVTVHTGVGFPDILSDGADLPEMDLGVTFRTNLAGITRLAGADTGRPEVVMGVRAIDCPELAMPSKLSPKDGMEHDLWLMMLTVRFS